MNYRHAFHAGNHGDVLKHVVLSRVLEYFKQKPSAFAVLDAHAGIGHYDLTGREAFKTGEWRGGLARLLAELPDVADRKLLEPYLKTIQTLNPDGTLRHAPGSPEVARQLLRPQDRLFLNELHPDDYQTLQARYASSATAHVTNLDATVALKAALPFTERRGVVLIDPAFEVADETTRVARMLRHSLQRMAQLCLVIWYPVTTQGFADQFCTALPLAEAKSALRLEVKVRAAVENGGLAGSGVVVVNPPWTLQTEAEMLLPYLAHALGEQGQGQAHISWVKSEA